MMLFVFTQHALHQIGIFSQNTLYSVLVKGHAQYNIETLSAIVLKSVSLLILSTLVRIKSHVGQSTHVMYSSIESQHMRK